jgi:hypothetical protein
MAKKSYTYIDRDFQKLAIQVNQAIIENKADSKDKKAQEILVKKVANLEIALLNNLRRYAKTQELYGQFISFVLDDLGNILSARPYFREDQGDFTKFITPAIKTKNPKKLMTFQANYMLIKFVIDRWGEPLPDTTQDIFNRFLAARNTLIENNLPLAINRAMLFYRKVPKSHLSLLDFIDICTQGLIIGIDKYSGDWKPNWSGVCIGRMVGFMIEEYSRSLIRMFPNDKKILYRANSLKYKLKTDDINVICKAVNDSFLEDAKEGKSIPKLPIAVDYLKELMNASSTISADSTLDDDEEGESLSLYDYQTDGEDTVGEQVERADMMHKVAEASAGLLIVEKKIIKLKGVDL